MRLIKKIKNIWRAFWKRKLHAIVVTADISILKDGKVIETYKNVEGWWNGLMDEGEQNMLDVYFRNQNAPTNFYCGLGNNGGTPGIPADTATLSTITEVSGTNYARQLIERSTTGWPNLVLDDGDYQVESKSVSFTNTGTTNWTSIDYLFITDVASGTSGKLLVTIAMPSSKILAPNESLVIDSIKIKAQ